MSEQRAILSFIGLILVIMIVGWSVRYVRSLDWTVKTTTTDESVTN